MKTKKQRIDNLIVLYIFGLLSLGILWYSEGGGFSAVIVLPDEDGVGARELVRIDTLSRTIFTMNPTHDLIISIDGGDTWHNEGAAFNWKDVIVNSYSSIPTSISWHPPRTNAGTIVSFRYAVLDKNCEMTSSDDVYTDFTSLKSAIPIVHLSVSEDGLFDDFKGIYVPGFHSWNESEFKPQSWKRKGNFLQRGSEWERSVRFQYFARGKEIMNEQCGVRIYGNSTRRYPQKSFKIIARKKYGEGKLRIPFFGGRGLERYESLLLRMSGNDNDRTLFADLLMHELADGAQLLTQRGFPVSVLINGNYWGVYNLRERIDDYFVAKYSGCRKRDVTILATENYALKNGAEIEKMRFLNLIEEIKRKEIISDDYLQIIENEVDLSSYMDFVFFQTFYANTDFKGNSVCYHVRNEKWRWVLKDLDFSLSNQLGKGGGVDFDMFQLWSKSTGNQAEVFNKLITNQDFKRRFVSRCHKNLGSFLSDSRIHQVYNSLKERYDNEIGNSIDRWRNIPSVSQWNVYCEKNLRFLLERRGFYEGHIAAL